MIYNSHRYVLNANFQDGQPVATYHRSWRSNCTRSTCATNWTSFSSNTRNSNSTDRTLKKRNRIKILKTALRLQRDYRLSRSIR